MIVTDKQKLYKMLKAIAEGYRVDVHYDSIIRVEDPEALLPQDDPFIVLDIVIAKNILKD